MNVPRSWLSSVDSWSSLDKSSFVSSSSLLYCCEIFEFFLCLCLNVRNKV
eukprot:TRINITY_DN89768_c0_g1_i1.p3 TRINITY_DN89768_c0_g1~~TRINITY_DN89768_c0_g1_i1.p3  ORF type:complete len:50 (+),score=1.38 TRINITY_DN89768_c0_g1_i1:218-367(+)